ncbi:hypothetical protein CFC21_039147 [Triticum aestivum]|uniref:Spt20-like SEP domain-containing protein n=4 Tax=Triticum TaxID=4564 RepID=A0A9R1RW12_TRITD|nr:hypothetical protein CFC21_039147 [Triticum aestivum]VAH71232.1 unnamed protein product [Triticum turgidum subsp. durum]
MLVFLIGDDLERMPYTRASTALLSDIEYGCLPKDILHGVPCKFQNGIVVCEVRDYRSFLSNGDNSSEDDFPIMNRIALRLGTECVVNDLSLIADASWTYHEKLIAESTIINSLQPRLNLDPKPCLEKLCNSVKKIDLGLHKGRQRMKETSLLNISPGPPEQCKPKECDACEGAAVCIENSALEVLPSGILSCSPVNCPSPPQVNSAKSTAVSDPEDTTQCSSSIINSSAFCDREQSASSTPASDNFLQNHDQHQVDLDTMEVDHKKGRFLRETVLPQKRKEGSNLEHERLFSDKSARLSSRSSDDQFQKSAEAPNKEGLMLGSPKELSAEDKVYQIIGNKDMEVHQQKSFSTPSLNIKDPCPEKFAEKVKQGSRKELPVEVMVDQTMSKKDMRLQEQKPFSVVSTNHSLPSFNRNESCLEQFPEKVKLGSQKELPVEVKLEQSIGRGKENEPLSILPATLPHSSLNRNSLHIEKIPEKVHCSDTRMRESHLVSCVDVDNHGGELKDSSVTPVTSCNASSRNADAKPQEDKASMEPQPTTSKIKVSETSTISLNQQIHFEGQKQADILVRRSCEDRSSIVPGVTDGTSSQFGISPDIEVCIGHPLYNIEPNIERILSEVILTTQRHAPDGNAAKIDGLETLTPVNSCSPSCFIRYEGAEGSPYTREETISCCLTRRTKHTRNIRSLVFHRVQYFCRGIIDQSHYILCLLESDSPDDHQIAVEMISGHERFHIATLPTSDQAKKFVDQFILLMKRDGYTLCNSTVCNGFSELTQQSADVSQPGYLTGEHPQYQGFSPSVAKTVVINECKDTGFASEKRLPGPNVHANARQQGSQQWGLPDVHANVLYQGSRQWGLPDVHANAQHEGSHHWGMRDAHRNAMQQGSTQQWGQSYAHTNAPRLRGKQQRGKPYADTNVLQRRSNQQRGKPYAHASFPQQGSNQQWWQPYAHANVPQQGGNQQWGQTYAHANVRRQGSQQQWGMPDGHANLRRQGSQQQWGMPDDHSTNAMHQGSQQQWVQPEQQHPTPANVDASHFSNPGYPAEQQYNSRAFQQDQRRPPFSGGACPTDQHQHYYYPQSRHDIPGGSSERYPTTASMGAGSYGQWHQTPTPPPQQHDGTTYRWRFQDLGRQAQINNLPPMQAGRSVLLSGLHPAGGPQTSSPATGSDGSVTSTFLVPPSGYHQYPPPPSHGIC